jgi:hypothetical protein
VPTTETKVPASPDWLHEIKYDGCRLRVERNGDRVRLITRGGYDWTKRFPWIVEAALKKPPEAFRHRWRGSHPRCRWLFRFQRSAFRQAQRRGPALRLRCAGAGWRRSTQAPALDAQDQILRGFLPCDQLASSSVILNKAKLAPTCSAKSASLGLRDWLRNVAIDPTAPAGQNAG